MILLTLALVLPFCFLLLFVEIVFAVAGVAGLAAVMASEGAVILVRIVRRGGCWPRQKSALPHESCVVLGGRDVKAPPK